MKLIRTIRLSVVMASVLLSSFADARETLSAFDYIIDHDSLMPGFCKLDDNGQVEGVFRANSSGITLWRNYKPEAGEGMLPTIMKDQLAEQLRKVHFALPHSVLNHASNWIIGSVRIEDDQRDVVLRLHIPSMDEELLVAVVEDTLHESNKDELVMHSGMNYCVMFGTREPEADSALGQRVLSTTR